jgi:hypothetical protein
MGLLDRMRAKREAAAADAARLREEAAAKATLEKYNEDLAAWEAWSDELLLCLDLAREGGATDGDSPLALKKGEELFMVAHGAALVEPRRLPGQWVGRSQGMSVRVMKGVTYRVGANRGTYVQGGETPTAIDTGTISITNRRVVFQGAKQSREWLYSKLIGFQHDAEEPITYLQVSNRQKTSGFMYDQASAQAVRLRLAIGLAWADGDASEVFPVLHGMMEEHKAALPALGAAGITPRTRPSPNVSSRLVGGSSVEVVGESYRQNALLQVAGGYNNGGLQLTASLVPEPSNAHDANAVRVDIDGQPVGYLERELAAEYSPVLLAGGHRAYECECELFGGWDRGEGDRGNYGVRLDLAAPDRCLA